MVNRYTKMSAVSCGIVYRVSAGVVAYCQKREEKDEEPNLNKSYLQTSVENIYFRYFPQERFRRQFILSEQRLEVSASKQCIRSTSQLYLIY